MDSNLELTNSNLEKIKKKTFTTFKSNSHMQNDLLLFQFFFRFLMTCCWPWPSIIIFHTPFFQWNTSKQINNEDEPLISQRNNAETIVYRWTLPYLFSPSSSRKDRELLMEAPPTKFITLLNYAKNKTKVFRITLPRYWLLPGYK